MNYFRKNKQKGVTSYLTVMFMALVATLVIAIIQSRLITGIYRQRALSDTLKNSYGAESEIYDLLAKIIHFGFTPPANYTKTLGDGTELTIDTVDSGDTQTITILANRPFAVNKIVGERTSSVSTVLDRLEIILALDCTGSMDDPAVKGDTACSDADPATECISRFEAQKNAVANLVSTVKDGMTPEESAIVHIGVSVFGGGKKEPVHPDDVIVQWLTLSNDPLVPTNDHQRILDYLDGGFTRGAGDRIRRDTSPACCHSSAHRKVGGGCQLITEGTSIGSGYSFSNDYFNANPVPVDQTYERAEIVLSDGIPNSRDFNYPQCPLTGTYYPPDPPTYCNVSMPPPYKTICGDESRDFLRCTLANDATEVDEISAKIGPPPFYGTRTAANAAYGVLVYDPVPVNVKNIFTTYAGKLGENYFELANANNLTGILEDILGEIVESTLKITIKRGTP